MVGRLRAYMAVVSAIGLVVLALLAASVDLGRVRDSLPEGAMLALVVLVAPFLSIPLSRNGRGPSVHVDTPFVFALALAAGAGAAALVMAASGLLYDLAHRKPLLQGGLQQRHPHASAWPPGCSSGRPWPAARSPAARPCRRSWPGRPCSSSSR